MTKEIDIKITTSPVTDFEDLHNKVDSLLAECNIKMTSLIEEFNVLIQENDELDSEEDIYYSAIEVRPGNNEALHHTVIVAVPPGLADELDANDEGYGYVFPP